MYALPTCVLSLVLRDNIFTSYIFNVFGEKSLFPFGICYLLLLHKNINITAPTCLLMAQCVGFCGISYDGH